MPFLQRRVEPVFLSRKPLRNAAGDLLVDDHELEAVNNNTLACALRQLASLVLIANDIFADLTKQLGHVAERSKRLRTRINRVEDQVAAFNPKTVTVPESDICTFSLLKTHYVISQPGAVKTCLFTPATRPRAVQCLYDAAGTTPVNVIRQMDEYRRDGTRSSRYFMCTPVLGKKKRRIRHRPGMEIETRTPALFDDLRRWTSREALGDVTVAPDCTSRISLDHVASADITDGVADTVDHKLPSPEEQVQVVALHFPSQLVKFDVSGRQFDRMTSTRRSLVEVGDNVKRRSRSRRPRGKRRNTIAACTDKRELELAITAGTSTANDSMETSTTVATCSTTDPARVTRSRSSDLLRGRRETTPSEHHRSRFDSLRQWGKVKLRMIRGKSVELETRVTPLPEDINIYETVNKGRRSEGRQDRKSQLPISTSSSAMTLAVKLREGSLRQRKRHSGSSKDEPIHSSSGNWSASSESGRASIGSENTTTTHQPKSTTTLSSPGTSSISLNHPVAPSSIASRRRFNTSTSSSFSEGTLTPDIVDDGENSSIYSCDTEGYYTSFHMDSGLKTLKEEDTPITALLSTTALSHSPRMSAENEYELFGKGSTSTTTSSAGTVCTTLLAGANDSTLSLAPAPAVPERISSLDTKTSALIHHDGRYQSYSPDSGHNTSSSPVDSTSSPQGTLRSSEYDFSESDFEGVDRIERIRVKTTIDSSRIPSMCVITPPQSDDEASLTHYGPLFRQNELPKSYYTSLPRNFEKNATLGDEYSKVDRNKLKLNLTHLQETHFDCEVDRLDKLMVEMKHDDVDSGDYVRIADTRTTSQLYANCSKRTEELTVKKVPENGKIRESEYATVSKTPAMSPLGKIRDTEYVCLNELPALQSPADSLERKKRQGARVKLDSDGKVVYSSDSLKRVKGHSTFEPGPYVKDTIISPTASPIPLHRVPKSNIRPVNVQNNKTSSRALLPNSPKLGKVIIRANSPARVISARSVSPKHVRTVTPTRESLSPTARRSISPKNTRIVTPTENRTTPRSFPSPTENVDVLPTVGTSLSPTLVCNALDQKRPLSPQKETLSPTIMRGPIIGAYVNIQDDRSSSSQDEEGKIPPVPTNPKQLTSYLQRTNPSLFNRLNDPNKVKRSDSYRMANSSLLGNKEATVNTFHSKVTLEAKRGDLNSPLTFPEKADKEVVNPNALGRKFYGAQLKVDPSILSSVSLASDLVLSNRERIKSERAKFLETGNNPESEIW